MKGKAKRANIPLTHAWEAEPARIISDAAIATVDVGDGRLIPLLIVDRTERPDIEELARIHEYVAPGDVKVQWGHLESAPDDIALILRFTRPAEVLLVLNFDIVKQWVIVDQILSSKALYIQPGQEGDRLSNTLDSKKILIEVPETGFGKIWEGIFPKHLVKDIRKRGLSKHQAREAAKSIIDEWRKFGRLRPWPN